MMEIPKKYKGQRRKDLLKILEFANLAGLRHIAFSQRISAYLDPIPDAFYNRSQKSITISSDFNSEEIISILLHELGHHIEMNQRNFIEDENNVLIDTSNLMPENEKERKKYILLTEQMAWHYGEQVAKLLKIKLPKNHNKIKKVALDSYRK